MSGEICNRHCGFYSKSNCIYNLYQGKTEEEPINLGENCLHPQDRNVPPLPDSLTRRELNGLTMDERWPQLLGPKGENWW